MIVFNHRLKEISFPIGDHLIALMLGGQGVGKVSSFPLWILYFVESA